MIALACDHTGIELKKEMMKLLFMGKCASVRAAERLRFFRSWIWELLCMIP